VLSVVAPGTFRALGIPVKSGRDFSDTDTLDKPFVAIVNQALVRRAFPGTNPIGRTVFCPFDSLKGMTVVGVVGDVRQRGPEHDPTAECYMTYRQHQYNQSALSIVVRTSGDPNALTQTLRRVARETSPEVPVTFTTMESIVSENEAAPRFRTLLFGIFAGLAVCLAMAGVYGVTAYAAGQRSTEIGLRMALGASGGSVLRLILGQGLRLAGVGLVLGLAIAVAGTRLLRTVLFEVQPNDLAVYLVVTGLLGVVALVASYVPARRATRVDPAIALRCE
jgi:predicted permease